MSFIKLGSRITLVGTFAIAGLMGVNAHDAWKSESEVRGIAAKIGDSVQQAQLTNAANRLNSLGHMNFGGAIVFLGLATINLAARRRVDGQAPGASPSGQG